MAYGTSPRTLTGYRMGPRLVRVDLVEMDALLTPIPTAATGGLDGQADRPRPAA